MISLLRYLKILACHSGAALEGREKAEHAMTATGLCE